MSTPNPATTDWVPLGGPPGPAGMQGIQGIQGPQGPAGSIPGRLGASCLSISDWNAALDNGWYMGAGLPNSPPGLAGWVLGQVLQHNPSWITQQVWDFTGGPNPRVYRRLCSNGSWGAWYLVSTHVQGGTTGQIYGQGTDNWVWFPFQYNQIISVVANMLTTDASQSGGDVVVWGIAVNGFHVSHGQGGTRDICWMSHGI